MICVSFKLVGVAHLLRSKASRKLSDNSVGTMPAMLWVTNHPLSVKSRHKFFRLKNRRWLSSKMPVGS